MSHSNQRLEQALAEMWRRHLRECETATDFKNHALPLARIKKIIKSDEDVRMVSAEAPIIFGKACELFVQELTLRAWAITEEAKRRTLQRSDVSAAIQKTDIFDFLIDIVPKEDLLVSQPNVHGSLSAPPVHALYANRMEHGHGTETGM
ncbi:probable transcription factor Hap5a [Cyanidioschyzon merolae strain 10D]|jgi:nuclear transcription factor Y gamma|uniref:Probable transcription factor Hap5a n=1 Tax=Cyanidioschyzon merolae (strain NIES-3377 / 10D) TaxID=280699 RepID=M1US41_CYAM1|nr:probable transcription factor Hap5a [Cyanidioschyzon merolae strain 10D]BAM80466.1 probable transcription factor Hap5a [Cyanidioschyzon merolae strain 10D]|eukprot:XP_005536502.1 probable transcription factor Hap5a [Cyanidioschyzon merolae strain 10D]